MRERFRKNLHQDGMEVVDQSTLEEPYLCFSFLKKIHRLTRSQDQDDESQKYHPRILRGECEENHRDVKTRMSCLGSLPWKIKGKGWWESSICQDQDDVAKPISWMRWGSGARAKWWVNKNPWWHVPEVSTLEVQKGIMKWEHWYDKDRDSVVDLVMCGAWMAHGS